MADDTCAACGAEAPLPGGAGIWVRADGSIYTYLLCAECTAELHRNPEALIDRVELRLLATDGPA